MRIWQNFRDRRSAIALLSALFALVFAVLELRTLFQNALMGIRASDPNLAASLAVGIVSLSGSVVALRRGNLVFLLVAWAFVLGNKFGPILRFLDELSFASRGNLLLAVLSANLNLVLALVGAALGFIAAFLRRARRTREVI